MTDHPTPHSPSCYDGVTIACPICQRAFAASGRRTYCSDACKAAAYRRRRVNGHPPVTIPDPRPRRPVTIYECDNCGARALGDQRCDECRTFMRRIGIGGCCPECDEPIAVQELLGQGGDRATS